jgi:RNA polymerase sigma-70 factor (ECF subfamily)
MTRSITDNQALDFSREDLGLVEKILTGDKRSLLILYRRYKPQLESFIRTKVNKEEDCEEVLQDTLFAFIEALRDFHGKSKVKTFLFAICNHKIIDYYRRKKIKHLVFSQMPQLEFLVSPLLEPEEVYDEKQMREKISRVFSAILPHYRDILKYKYIEGRSVEDIAHTMNVSFKSVESRLFRARKAFAEVYSTTG